MQGSWKNHQWHLGLVKYLSPKDLWWSQTIISLIPLLSDPPSFQTESCYIAPAGFELVMLPILASNLGYSCLCLPSYSYLLFLLTNKYIWCATKYKFLTAERPQKPVWLNLGDIVWTQRQESPVNTRGAAPKSTPRGFAWTQCRVHQISLP